MSDATAKTGRSLQIEMLKSVLESERRLRLHAEDEMWRVRALLEDIARHLAADVVESYQKRNIDGLRPVDSEVLATEIIRSVKRQNHEATMSSRQESQQVAELRAQVEREKRLRQEAEALVGELHQTIARLEIEKEESIKRVASAYAKRKPGSPPPKNPERTTASEVPQGEVEPEAEPEVEPAPEPTTEEDHDRRTTSVKQSTIDAPMEYWPAWFRDWVTSQNFARDRHIIEVLGDTGEPRRATVVTLAANRGTKDKSGGTETRALKSIVDRALVVITVCKRRGNPAHLIHLSERGEQAYRLLRGSEPVEQETPQLLALHKSPAHTYLILDTQLCLEDAGYEVERYFEPIDLGKLGRYYPDLIAHYQGRTFYIEAERSTFKDEEYRQRKWLKAMVASGGELSLAIEHKDEHKAFVSCITYNAGQLGMKTRLRFMATSSLLGNQQKPQGMDIWFYDEEIKAPPAR